MGERRAGESAGLIFISHRHADNFDRARLIYERLVKQFGQDRVFFDVSNIDAGDAISDEVRTALGRASALVLIIGKVWLTVANDRGERRIDDRSDPVRIEVEYALDHSLKLVPVLLDDTRIPTVEQLPASLAALPDTKCVRVRGTEIDADVTELLRALDPQGTVFARRSSDRIETSEPLRLLTRRARVEVRALPPVDQRYWVPTAIEHDPDQPDRVLDAIRHAAFVTGVVLVGKAGSGKSVLARRLVDEHLEARRGPVAVVDAGSWPRLAGTREIATEFWSFVGAQLCAADVECRGVDSGVAEAEIGAALKQAGALVIVDGLDAIHPRHREAFDKLLAVAAEDLQSEGRGLIATCRSGATGSFPRVVGERRLERIDLLPLPSAVVGQALSTPAEVPTWISSPSVIEVIRSRRWSPAETQSPHEFARSLVDAAQRWEAPASRSDGPHQAPFVPVGPEQGVRSLGWIARRLEQQREASVPGHTSDDEPMFSPEDLTRRSLTEVFFRLLLPKPDLLHLLLGIVLGIGAGSFVTVTTGDPRWGIILGLVLLIVTWMMADGEPYEVVWHRPRIGRVSRWLLALGAVVGGGWGTVWGLDPDVPFARGIIGGILFGLVYASASLVMGRRTLVGLCSPKQQLFRSAWSLVSSIVVLSVPLGMLAGVAKGWAWEELASDTIDLVHVLGKGVGLGFGIGVTVGLYNGGLYFFRQMWVLVRLRPLFPVDISDYFEWAYSAGVMEPASGGHSARFTFRVVQEYLADVTSSAAEPAAPMRERAAPSIRRGVIAVLVTSGLVVTAFVGIRSMSGGDATDNDVADDVVVTTVVSVAAAPLATAATATTDSVAPATTADVTTATTIVTSTAAPATTVAPATTAAPTTAASGVAPAPGDTAVLPGALLEQIDLTLTVEAVEGDVIERPDGIAIDANGRLIVSDQSNRGLVRIDPESGVAERFDSDLLTRPDGVAVLGDLVVVANNDSAEAFARSGVAVLDLDAATGAMLGRGVLRAPVGVAAQGDAALVSRVADGEISWLRPSGPNWTVSTAILGEPDHPHDLAVLGHRLMFTRAQGGSIGIQALDQLGGTAQTLEGDSMPSDPDGIAVGAGRIWITADNRLWWLDETGNGQWEAFAPRGSGQLRGLAFDPERSVLYACADAGILQFDLSSGVAPNASTMSLVS